MVQRGRRRLAHRGARRHPVWQMGHQRRHGRRERAGHLGQVLQHKVEEVQRRLPRAPRLQVRDDAAQVDGRRRRVAALLVPVLLLVVAVVVVVAERTRSRAAGHRRRHVQLEAARRAAASPPAVRAHPRQ
ncbi:hypothetical protein STCU_12122 [Strigomonas culicis]|uniref:Uncharacterized protein n=1 Tax=Strigomonas culicis TaxID=28005 RepID=S9UKW5_9TRYP|nr:hypothetical protein STCU_12122 [Strigomonas culicis]|eukprot:EPY15321.1 hypothetical protein STCU_12122 [Strigomonas culicis]